MRKPQKVKHINNQSTLKEAKKKDIKSICKNGLEHFLNLIKIVNPYILEVQETQNNVNKTALSHIRIKYLSTIYKENILKATGGRKIQIALKGIR